MHGASRGNQSHGGKDGRTGRRAKGPSAAPAHASPLPSLPPHTAEAQGLGASCPRLLYPFPTGLESLPIHREPPACFISRHLAPTSCSKPLPGSHWLRRPSDTPRPTLSCPLGSGLGVLLSFPFLFPPPTRPPALMPSFCLCPFSVCTGLILTLTPLPSPTCRRLAWRSRPAPRGATTALPSPLGSSWSWPWPWWPSHCEHLRRPWPASEFYHVMIPGECSPRPPDGGCAGSRAQGKNGRNTSPGLGARPHLSSVHSGPGTWGGGEGVRGLRSGCTKSRAGFPETTRPVLRRSVRPAGARTPPCARRQGQQSFLQIGFFF